MTAAGQRFRRTERATADAGGAASCSVQPPGNVDYVILLANVSTSTNVLQPTGIAYVNGFQVDSSDGASLDSSDTRVLLRSGDVYEFRWTGADVGAVCTLNINGVQYPAGQGPME